jgi:hypothetical protein
MTELAHLQKGKVYRLQSRNLSCGVGTVRRDSSVFDANLALAFWKGDSLGLGREPRHGEGNG